VKTPCIRNLDPFRKKGCPQKIWSADGEGCPCWIEMDVASRENPQKREIKKDCIDLWQFSFQWAMLGLLEGNQRATESFRNGMVQPGEDGKDHPKPDPATVQLYKLFDTMKNEQRIILEHETKKQIIEGKE